jgi:hypothetical protein
MAMIARANVASIEGVSLDTGDDQIQITVVGVLRNNDVVGSETSGTVITSKRISFGVEFDGNVAFEKSAIRYDGRRVFVSGELEEKSGTARGERWVIHATRIRLFGEAGSG